MPSFSVTDWRSEVRSYWGGEAEPLMSQTNPISLQCKLARRALLGAPLLVITKAIAQPPRALSSLRQLGVTELENRTHHVQGIVVDRGALWVSSVGDGEGFLHKFELTTGKHLATMPVHDGKRFHVGGIDRGGNSLWVPVAEYRKNSASTVLQVDMRTLAIRGRFEVDDHIGCVAVLEDRLIGGNWDSRQFFSWDQTGKLIEKRANPHAVAYQDLKFHDGVLIASGNLSREEGATDWLDPATLELRRRIHCGKTDRGVRYTNEGMDVADGKLYLLPEDGPSRLFQFQL